jgi:hypothetical protein
MKDIGVESNTASRIEQRNESTNAIDKYRSNSPMKNKLN